jgi:hypothetical protein
MRFLVMVKSTAESEAGKLPTNEMMAAMAKFNAELEAAGMLVTAGGLKPTRAGARIHWSDKKPKVSDGPFAETKELVGGFWILEAKSREELVAFMQRAPFVDGTIEIRGFLGPEDFAKGSAG